MKKNNICDYNKGYLKGYEDGYQKSQLEIAKKLIELGEADIIETLNNFKIETPTIS